METRSPRLADGSLFLASPSLNRYGLPVRPAPDRFREGECRRRGLVMTFPNVGAGLEGRAGEPRIQDAHPLLPLLVTGAVAGTGPNKGDDQPAGSDCTGPEGPSSSGS